MATLQIVPCTVSQLLYATHVSNGSFAICDLELNQVSVVGTVRGMCPCTTYIQYFVDDMTGPPLHVKQWVNSEASSIKRDYVEYPAAAAGKYVKVVGRLQNIKGQTSLLAMNFRWIEDLNEITSHMLEVVHAHMQLFGKVCDVDVNMNALAASSSGVHTDLGLNGLSTIQTKMYERHNALDQNLTLGSIIVPAAPYGWGVTMSFFTRCCRRLRDNMDNMASVSRV